MSNVLYYIQKKLMNIFSNTPTTNFVQYVHIGSCDTPCADCPARHLKIYQVGSEVKLPAHPYCDCKYNEVDEQNAGTISNKGVVAPDVYLKAYGKLPDYYITKEEARSLGWSEGKNLAHFAPGKMIGGDIFKNKDGILPEKEGRIWYECDVGYVSLKRNKKRLYYSNDGLMFYTTVHDETSVIFIK